MQPPPTRVGEQAIKNVSSKHIVFGAKPKILLLHGSITQLWVKIPDRAYVAQCLVSSHSVHRDRQKGERGRGRGRENSACFTVCVSAFLYYQQVDLPSVVLHRRSMRLLRCPWTCQRGNQGSHKFSQRCPRLPLRARLLCPAHSASSIHPLINRKYKRGVPIVSVCSFIRYWVFLMFKNF